MSTFITFEGGEGSGKSTQARALHRHLAGEGVDAVLTHEPGGTPLGTQVRRWLKREGAVDPLAELLLFNASRAQLVANVIRPALERGSIVICDRFYHSTVAYQGYGRGLDMELVSAINDLGSQWLVPDLVILLDIDVERGLGRKRLKDRFEHEAHAFHRKVRQGYLEMAEADPQRWLVIDATLPRKRIERAIWQRVRGLAAGVR